MSQKCDGDNQSEIKTTVYDIRGAQSIGFMVSPFTWQESDFLSPPAASMPIVTKQAGAKLVIINYTPTDMDSQADIVIHEKAGKVMEAILEKVKQRL